MAKYRQVNGFGAVPAFHVEVVQSLVQYLYSFVTTRHKVTIINRGFKGRAVGFGWNQNELALVERAWLLGFP